MLQGGRGVLLGFRALEFRVYGSSVCDLKLGDLRLCSAVVTP